LHTKITIHTETITLGQFLKLTNVLDSGGMIKNYLKDVGVYINGELEHRRGRKLYAEDVVEIKDVDSFVVKREEE